MALAGGATVASSGLVATGSRPIRSNTTLLAPARLAALRPPELSAIWWASSVNGVIEALWITSVLPLGAVTVVLARNLKVSGSATSWPVASSLEINVLPGAAVTTNCTAPV